MSLSVTHDRNRRPRRPGRVLADVTATRKAAYSIEGDDVLSGVLKGAGREGVVGKILPDEVLHDLFKLRGYVWDWRRRQRKQSELEEVKRGLEVGWVRETYVTTPHFKSIAKLADPRACAEAKRRFEDELVGFLKLHGPLVESDRVIDFVRKVDDLVVWALQPTQWGPIISPGAYLTEEALELWKAGMAGVDAALKSITHRPGGKKICPTLFAALAWAIDQKLLYGIEYRECDDEDCPSVFIPLRSDAKYCSDRCKQRAYRRRKRA